jgi:hypothetical protein
MSELVKFFGRNAKRDIIAYIVESFFGTDRIVIKQGFRDIAYDNAVKFKWATKQSFYYKGRMWPDFQRGKYEQVHHSFEDKLDPLILQHDMLETAVTTVEGYLRKMMSISNSIRDIYVLTPPELEGHLPESFNMHYSSSLLTLSNERITSFQLKNKDSAASAKAYLFYKALFARK